MSYCGWRLAGLIGRTFNARWYREAVRRSHEYHQWRSEQLIFQPGVLDVIDPGGPVMYVVREATS